MRQLERRIVAEALAEPAEDLLAEILGPCLLNVIP